MSTDAAEKPSWFWRNAWVLVVLAFVLLISAWTAFIVIAQKNKPLLVEPKAGESVGG